MAPQGGNSHQYQTMNAQPLQQRQFGQPIVHNGPNGQPSVIVLPSSPSQPPAAKPPPVHYVMTQPPPAPPPPAPAQPLIIPMPYPMQQPMMQPTMMQAPMQPMMPYGMYGRASPGMMDPYYDGMFHGYESMRRRGRSPHSPKRSSRHKHHKSGRRHRRSDSSSSSSSSSSSRSSSGKKKHSKHSASKSSIPPAPPPPMQEPPKDDTYGRLLNPVLKVFQTGVAVCETLTKIGPLLQQDDGSQVRFESDVLTAPKEPQPLESILQNNMGRFGDISSSGSKYIGFPARYRWVLGSND